MVNIQKLFSRFKKNAGNTATNLKNQAQKFEEAKNQPKSKRKSLFLGFTTVLGIFGFTLLTPVLPAVAKEIPKQVPKPSGVTPASQSTVLSSKEIAKAVSGIAGSVCALAISSGSFVIGAACGVVVVYGILKVQGK